MNAVLVALGGAVGAVLRYALTSLPLGSAFPWLTLVVNLSGAFVLGMVSAVAGRQGISTRALLFLQTGLCGGYTTFSTFSLETVRLFETRHPFFALIYLFVSVAGGVLGFLLGQKIIR